MVPTAMADPVGRVTPPAGSTVIISVEADADRAMLKAASRAGCLPRSPSEIARELILAQS